MPEYASMLATLGVFLASVLELQKKKSLSPSPRRIHRLSRSSARCEFIKTKTARWKYDTRIPQSELRSRTLWEKRLKTLSAVMLRTGSSSQANVALRAGAVFANLR
jgi:hypothetical protein